MKNFVWIFIAACIFAACSDDDGPKTPPVEYDVISFEPAEGMLDFKGNAAAPRTVTIVGEWAGGSFNDVLCGREYMNEEDANGNFFDGKSPRRVYEDYYTYVYNNLKKYDDFCNLGHLNIIDRYAPEIAPFDTYSDIIEAILKHLIETGHGIELNTSSFRYDMKETCPSEAILRLYRTLGGEIITTGSDAHCPEHVAPRRRAIPRPCGRISASIRRDPPSTASARG